MSRVIRVALLLLGGLSACDAAGTRRTQPSSLGSLEVQPNEAQVVPSGTAAFGATIDGILASVTWDVVEQGGGSISASGLYQAPPVGGVFRVRATVQAAPSVQALATVTVTTDCWALQPVNRVRFYPRAGQAAAMVGATIEGSNDSPTNGFQVLATINAAPPEGQFTELTFTNTVPYRYVKYYGPAGGYGQIAEIEFYSGATRLVGTGFGTVGSRSGNPWPNALDGDPATFFDGPVADNVYVGIDAASGHVVETPTISPVGGNYTSSPTVTMSTATAGAAIRYSTNGTDPASGSVYAGPFVVPTGVTSVAAVATASCMLPSARAMAVYSVNGSTAAQASIHIGNSLTDSINAHMQPMAASGGIALDWSRYTVPGAGTFVYENYATGGNGLGSGANVQTTVRTKRFDHISMQPASNMPCVPTGHASEATADQRSDAVNIDRVWNDAVGVSPSVQMWVYSTWPGPTSYETCITGGRWLRDPAIWNPAAPTGWEDGVLHMLQFNEAVRAALVAAHPSRPPPYIVPAGSALIRLKGVIESGGLPGVAAGGFWSFTYQQGLGSDDHLTPAGQYLVTLVFYTSMFQRNPDGLAFATTGLTAAQAAVLQRVARETVAAYALSGYTR